MKALELRSGATSYLTMDTLGTARLISGTNINDSTGGVKARHDYLPFGEELGLSGGRTEAQGYVVDNVKQKFTSKERDVETGLDYFGARYYSSTQGRFTGTDPIIMTPERATDPQQINLYVYARNNPLRYIDPTGEIINEPTRLSERDQKRYDAWKAKFLSTEAGRLEWERYASDQNFTLDITLIDRGTDSRNASAEVKSFKFDGDGNFVGATMELGNNMGSAGSMVPERYPVLSTVSDENAPYDPHTRAAVKIAHEFGHLDNFRSSGRTFYEQQSLIFHRDARRTLLSLNAYENDPARQRIEAEFEQRFGETIAANSIRRDNNADRNAIPVIRQLVGNNITPRTQNAIKVLEKSN